VPWKRGGGLAPRAAGGVAPHPNCVSLLSPATTNPAPHTPLQQPGGFRPAKYFSIDRVFRNEALDATHLAEFHQVEGVVADRGLSLGHLIGLITEFFRRIGITRLRFKPAFNPYTEPSMEVFGYHPDLRKWTEIGNSGIFRPEMLAPMGLPPDVRVIAWGLSLERPTMIKYRLRNIRDLFGHKVRLEMGRSQPICRFEPPAGEEGARPPPPPEPTFAA
jgi:phenylalanyl-tRNA synthetase alpha chain